MENEDVKFKLDPRPARVLTSREIAKMLGAMVGVSVGSMLGADPSRTQEELSSTMKKSFAIAKQMCGAPGAFRTLTLAARDDMHAAMFAAQITGLVSDNDMCQPEEINCALGWWSETRGGHMAIEVICSRVTGSFSANKAVFDEGLKQLAKD